MIIDEIRRKIFEKLAPVFSIKRTEIRKTRLHTTKVGSEPKHFLISEFRIYGTRMYASDFAGPEELFISELYRI